MSNHSARNARGLSFKALLCLLPFLTAVLASCGGGGGGGSGAGPTPPSISSQPQNVSVSDGQTATFSVTAGGSAPLGYQWRSNGTDIAGATSSSYTTPALQLSDDGTEYTVVVSNSAGTKTSDAATVTVTPIRPSITAQPSSVSVGEGQPAMFSVTATGSATLTYQWKRDGNAISGATSASYTYPAATQADDGAQFTVTVTNGGGSVTSDPATLHINANAPVITAQPSNVSVSAGQPAMFSVTASGTGLTYQWKRGGTNIPGATAASYTLASTALTDTGASFTVAVSNVAGTVTSSAAVLTVVAIPPSITAQPQPQSVFDGNTATFAVVASGTAPLAFQWRRNGVNIPGANAATYTTPVVHVADSGALYSVAVSNPSGTVAVSGDAALTVSPVPPSITTQPQPQTVADGATATFTVVASGTGPLVYQWRRDGADIGGATSASYTTPVVHLADSGAVYSVAISNAAATGAVSNGATLTVNPAAPTITTQPLSQTVASGSTVNLTVVASGTAPFTYQWKKGGTDIPGATSDTYSIAPVTPADAGSYTVVVSNGTAPAATSNAAILTVTHTLSLLAGKLGGAGYDDGNGPAATFYNPAGIATDAAGNLYLSDQFNQLIRKVSPTGDVTTVAGTPGVPGSTNGPAASARFNAPQQVAVDSDGNLYVADSGNHVIRMITAVGVVSTYAGRAGTPGSTDGIGGAARFNSPSGVAVYQPAVPGPVTLVVADSGNSTIRLIDSSANVTTLAGTPGVTGATDDIGPLASFRTPLGLAVDPLSGAIYVADSANSTIRQVSNPGGAVTTVAGVAGGPGSTDSTGTDAKFRTPSAVTLDAAGANLYVADTGNQTIRQVTIPGAVVTTLAGSPQVRGTVDGTGNAARFSTPIGVAVNGSGEVFVADNINNVVRKITTPGAVVTTFAGNVGGRGFVDGNAADARFNNPHFITADAAGNLFLSDHYNDVIRKITPAGVVSTINGPFSGPYGVAADSQGNVYVADTNTNAIRKISSGGTVTLFAGGTLGFADGTGAAAKFKHPVAVATDSSDNVYVGDFDNNAIRMITPAGVVTTIAGSLAGAKGSVDGTGTNARFDGPRGLTVDRATGNLFVTDRNNGTVRLITMPGAVVSTYAGTAGAIGFADGTGAAAKFNWPNAPGLDADGNLYVTDSNNHAIRKITPSRVVTTVVGAQPGTPLSYKVILGNLPGSIDGPSSLAVLPGAPVRLAITDATENAILLAVLP